MTAPAAMASDLTGGQDQEAETRMTRSPTRNRRDAVGRRSSLTHCACGESVGMTEDDIDFRGALTDAAAAAFADGEFDCVGVFAPFWLTALERPGSHEVFTSADFPGLIPDHIVASRDIVDDNPRAVQKLVDAWYLTLD